MIWYPENFVFDEVYHAFTAKEYLKGNKDAWEWWTAPPPGVAYEWTHPPLAKEIMIASMFLLKTTDAWAWRIPGVILGVISVYLVYLLGKELFKNEVVSLISAFIFSIDGLNFVQSRIGMNDIYFVTFMLAAVLSFVKAKFFWAAFFAGLSFSSKWSAMYLIGFMVLYAIWKLKFKEAVLLIVVPLIIYMFSYLPFFLQGHTFDQFINFKVYTGCKDNSICPFGLQQQMWWYHTNLKASHDYSSPWWSWPLNLYPVWYFVQYHKESISNIFASGNPAVFWMGTVAIILSAKDLLLKRIRGVAITLLFFLLFWLPWALSPRIMFLYHYSPSVPFMSLLLGYQIGSLYTDKSSKKWAYLILLYLFLGFVLIYPVLIGIAIPKEFTLIFFRTNLTKNPFGG